MSDQTIEKPKRAKDVTYDDVIVEDLPAVEHGVRTSQLREKVNELFSNPDQYKKSDGSGYSYRSLASYAVKGSATGAMQGLRKHYGKDKDGSGFEFTIRTVNGRNVLFGKFDPTTRKPDFPEPGNVPGNSNKDKGKADKGVGEVTDEVGKTGREKAQKPGGGQ